MLQVSVLLYCLEHKKDIKVVKMTRKAEYSARRYQEKGNAFLAPKKIHFFNAFFQLENEFGFDSKSIDFPMCKLPLLDQILVELEFLASFWLSHTWG